MPYKLEKHGSGYKVKNVETGQYKSKKAIPKSRAEAQMRLLNAIDHGFKPTGKK